MVEATLKAIDRVLELKTSLRSSKVYNKPYPQGHIGEEGVSPDRTIYVIPRSNIFGAVHYLPNNFIWGGRPKPIISIRTSPKLLDSRNLSFDEKAIKKALQKIKYVIKKPKEGNNSLHTTLLIYRRQKNVGKIQFTKPGKGFGPEAELRFLPEHAKNLAALILLHGENLPALPPGQLSVRRKKSR